LGEQKVLVTAGASGIGREIVRAFAAAGARVFVCDVDRIGLDDLASEIPGLVTRACDISKRAEVSVMVASAAESLGGIDVLVNNAGIPGATAAAEDVDMDDWERVVGVNLNGTFNATRLAIPHLKKSAAGSIIILSSVAGRYGYRHRAAYSTTKWGLIGLTKTLSIELGAYGIRVNALMPGAVAGPRLTRVLEGRAKKSGQSIEAVTEAALGSQSIKEFVDPRDVAALAVFIASPNGRMISGAMLPIDGDMQTA
jgi:NAD(P)-dependent dehydrogenase (short-subunit alcohol dehydrogenase family)